jgi:oxaloacetate decarboxylase alpha subunit
MPQLRFIDVTLRDAHQSLWATRMTTAMMLPIAPRMDEIGFEAIDLMGAVTFDVCVRYLREDPWERIRRLGAAIRRTPLNMWVRSRSFISFDIVPDDVLELTIERAAANGIRRITVFDALHDVGNMAVAVRAGRRAGLHVTGTLIYTLSPVHTDAFYEAKAREVRRLEVDALVLKDPGGLLTPERVRTLVPILRRAAGRLPLQLHSHCVTGLGPLCYLEAIPLGVDAVHTAISPLAHGPSLPPTESIAAQARRLGRAVALDEEGLRAMAEHFRRVAERAGKPIGSPAEYDPFHYEHQVPGGMITNLEAQLAQAGLAGRLEDVLVECARIRQELGYPIMVTPFSQFVGTQAVLNIVQGERYRTIPTEVRKYCLGYYGRLPAPVEPDVLARVNGGPALPPPPAAGAPPPAVARLRTGLGPAVSDDELLLRFYFPSEHVDALRAAGPIRPEPSAEGPPAVALLRALASRRDLASVEVRGPGLRLSLRTDSAPGDGATAGPSPVVVTSPMVGRVRYAPGFGGSALLEVGALVEANAPVCFIEALRQRHPVPAPCRGRVVEVRIEDGQAVEYGEPLLRITPLPEGGGSL